jgi:hypothetical protein
MEKKTGKAWWAMEEEEAWPWPWLWLWLVKGEKG